MTKLYKIKPLVWERESSKHFHAQTFITIRYLISKFADSWWHSVGAAWIKCDSLEDGKAKCAEHYCALIEQALECEQWTAELPNEQANYWWWSGHEDDAPFLLHVMYSGTSKKYFVSITFDELTRDVDDKRWRGWWMKVPIPETETIKGEIK